MQSKEAITRLYLLKFSCIVAIHVCLLKLSFSEILKRPGFIFVFRQFLPYPPILLETTFGLSQFMRLFLQQAKSSTSNYCIRFC